ncbi:MAG: CBS domain-containing protein [Anaerolineae bacterium]|nr:CBS domain-containing protein [Anaerolineae bacterium]
MQLILSHEQGDFDAVASMLGAWLLNPSALPLMQSRLNRNVRHFLKLFKQELPFIEFADLPAEPIDEIFLVDTQSMPTIKGMNKNTRVKILDHHSIRNELPETWKVNFEPTGACTTPLIEQMRECNLKLNATQATLLLLGIYEDTGSLIYSHTTPRDIRAAAYLLEAGANLKIAAKYLNPPLSEQQKTLYDRLLTNAESHLIKGQHIIYSATLAPDMTDEISSVAHKMRDFLDPDALLLLVHTSDGFRLIARSTTDQVNVAALATHFGGGGHERAAAALIPRKSESLVTDEDLDRYRQEILSVLPECIHPAITVGKIMSRNPLLLNPATTTTEAAQLMQRYGYEGYPIIEDNRVVGLLTRRAVDRSTTFKLNLAAGSLMEAGEYYVTPDDSLDHLQQVMDTSNWGQIPVLDPKTQKIIGIVTRTDLFKSYTSRKSTGGLPQRNNLSSRLESILPPGKLALLRAVAEHAHQQHLPLYIVGGFVRDLLLNRPSYDFDLVVEGDALSLGEKLKQVYGGHLTCHKQFGTAKWAIGAIHEHLATTLGNIPPGDLPASIDLISARVEFYDRPTALPTVERSSIKFDLHRRDFSINTMALRLDGSHYGELYDYWGGMNDLRQGTIRVLHSLSFVDDPTRMLRAVRFEQRFKFKIETRTLKLLKEAQCLVEHVSGDRLRHELDLMVSEPEVLAILTRANTLGLLSAIHPHLKWTNEDAAHVSPALNNDFPAKWGLEETYFNLPARRVLFFLLWLVRYPERIAAVLVKRLRFSKNLQDALLEFIRLRPDLPGLENASPSQVNRRLDGLPLIVIFAAYLLNISPEVNSRIENYVLSWQYIKPVTDGKKLTGLKIKTGPLYRTLLNLLKDAWLDQKVNSPAEEEDLLKMILHEHPDWVES